MRKLALAAMMFAMMTFALPTTAVAEEEREDHPDHRISLGFSMPNVPESGSGDNPDLPSVSLGYNLNNNLTVDVSYASMADNISYQWHRTSDFLGGWEGVSGVPNVDGEFAIEYAWIGLNATYTHRTSCDGPQTWIYACNVSPFFGAGVRREADSTSRDEEMEPARGVVVFGGLVLDLTETFGVVFSTQYAPAELHSESFGEDRTSVGLSFAIAF